MPQPTSGVQYPAAGGVGFQPQVIYPRFDCVSHYSSCLSCRSVTYLLYNCMSGRLFCASLY